MRLTSGLRAINREALRSYLRGMSLGFDPFPVSDIMSRVLTDEESMWKDWEAIGGDMRAAFDRVLTEERREGRR